MVVEHGSLGIILDENDPGGATPGPGFYGTNP